MGLIFNLEKLSLVTSLWRWNAMYTSCTLLLYEFFIPFLPLVIAQKPTGVPPSDVVNGEAWHWGHVVEHGGVNPESAAVLDVRAPSHMVPGHVGGWNFSFTRQSDRIPFKDDLWYDRELSFIWKPKEKNYWDSDGNKCNQCYSADAAITRVVRRSPQHLWCSQEWGNPFSSLHPWALSVWGPESELARF